MSLDPNLLKILVCPACKGALTYDADNARLDCEACRLRYPVDDDVPIMLVEEAESY